MIFPNNDLIYLMSQPGHYTISARKFSLSCCLIFGEKFQIFLIETFFLSSVISMCINNSLIKCTKQLEHPSSVISKEVVK